MTPWFTATEPFTPADGDKWRKYIEWSGLTQLTELITLDGMLCPPILSEIRDDYWPHIVNEDCRLNYFVDLEFLKSETAGVERKNLLCVIQNPDKEADRAPMDGFEFVGYDLLDLDNSVSALCNCGGFPDVFSNEELSENGLLKDFSRAAEIRTLLRSTHPEEFHANCNLWVVYRAI